MHARHSTQINDNSEEIKDLHAKFDASVETFCEHLSAETQARKALAQRIAEMQRVAEQQGWSESIVREPAPPQACAELACWHTHRLGAPEARVEPLLTADESRLRHVKHS